MKTPVIGRADIHPGTASDWLQTLQNLDGLGVIGRRRFFLRIQQIAYSNYIEFRAKNRCLRTPNVAWFGGRIRKRLPARLRWLLVASVGQADARPGPHRAVPPAHHAARSSPSPDPGRSPRRSVPSP